MSAERPIRVAGTAVVLRDAQEGVQVLMMRRPASGSFPGAWVFPGGSVDPEDEVGAASEADAARHACARETREEAGIRISDEQLLSRWTPPAETPVKFRTWFFLARDLGDEVRANTGEIEETAWLTPEEALRRHSSGDLMLFPPTWVTLHGLQGFSTVDEVFAARREPQWFATRMLETARGKAAVWLGDEEYPDQSGEPGARHRLDMGVLPWSYQRSGGESGL